MRITHCSRGANSQDGRVFNDDRKENITERSRVRRKIIGRDDDETDRPIVASIRDTALLKQRGETFPLF